MPQGPCTASTHNLPVNWHGKPAHSYKGDQFVMRGIPPPPDEAWRTYVSTELSSSQKCQGAICKPPPRCKQSTRPMGRHTHRPLTLCAIISALPLQHGIGTADLSSLGNYSGGSPAKSLVGHTAWRNRQYGAWAVWCALTSRYSWTRVGRMGAASAFAPLATTRSCCVGHS